MKDIRMRVADRHQVFRVNCETTADNWPLAGLWIRCSKRQWCDAVIAMSSSSGNPSGHTPNTTRAARYSSTTIIHAPLCHSSSSSRPNSNGSESETSSSARWNSSTRSPCVRRKINSRPLSVTLESPACRRKRRCSKSSSAIDMSSAWQPNSSMTSSQQTITWVPSLKWSPNNPIFGRFRSPRSASPARVRRPDAWCGQRNSPMLARKVCGVAISSIKPPGSIFALPFVRLLEESESALVSP